MLDAETIKVGDKIILSKEGYNAYRGGGLCQLARKSDYGIIGDIRQDGNLDKIKWYRNGIHQYDGTSTFTWGEPHWFNLYEEPYNIEIIIKNLETLESKL